MRYSYVIKILISCFLLFSNSVYSQDNINTIEYRIPLQSASKGKASDFLTDVEYIPLNSSDVKMDFVHSILQNEDSWFLCDGYKLVCFSIAGDFKWKVDVDKGKKDKIKNARFDFDKKNILLYLKDQVVTYSLEGKKVDVGNLSEDLIDSLSIGDEIYKILFPKKDSAVAIINVDNVNDKIIFEHPKDKTGSYPPIFLNQHVVTGPLENKYLIHYLFWDRIFQIGENKSVKSYKLVFPLENSFDFKSSSFTDPQELLKYFQSNTLEINLFHTLSLFKDYLIFRPSLARDVEFLYAYNTVDGSLINLTSLDNGDVPIISKLGAPVIYDEKNGYVVSFIYPDEINPSMGNDDTLGRNLLKSNNPIIVRFRIK